MESSMSKEFLARTATVDEASVQPFPNSRKIYVEGSRPDIRVPMREISQFDTPDSFGGEKTPPIYVYDTSGPYTDPEAEIDVRKGLKPVRAAWIAEREDTEQLDRLTSDYGRAREADKSLDELRFELTCARRVGRRRAGMSRRCTTRVRASSRRKWNTWRSAKTCCARSTSPG